MELGAIPAKLIVVSKCPSSIAEKNKNQLFPPLPLSQMNEGEGRNDRRKNSLEGSPYVVTDCGHGGPPKRSKKHDNSFLLACCFLSERRGLLDYFDHLQNVTISVTFFKRSIFYSEADMYTGFIDELVAKGRFCFTIDDIKKLTNGSQQTIRVALYRQQKKGELVMPHRGFYVILPPEHRSRGCLPPEQFIPDLMEYLRETYYVGLLSAAEYYGAAHQRPQVFQVIVAKSRRPLRCGKVTVQFIFRKNAAKIPTQSRNTPAGIIKIATPEATALDLIGYVKHCAGLDNVATTLTELSEKIEVKRLIEIAELSPIAWVQRLGYLFDRIGEQEKASVLTDYLIKKHPSPTALIPTITMKGSKKDDRWQIFVNADVESEV